MVVKTFVEGEFVTGVIASRFGITHLFRAQGERVTRSDRDELAEEIVEFQRVGTQIIDFDFFTGVADDVVVTSIKADVFDNFIEFAVDVTEAQNEVGLELPFGTQDQLIEVGRFCVGINLS